MTSFIVLKTLNVFEMKSVSKALFLFISEKETEKKMSDLMERLRGRASQMRSWSDTTKALTKVSITVSSNKDLNYN